MSHDTVRPAALAPAADPADPTAMGTPLPGGGRRESRLVKNISSSWAGLAAGILVSLFLSPFIVRALGDVYYGIWTLLLQFTGYLWLFDLGIRESVIKYVAQYHDSDQKDEVARTVNAALWLYSSIGLAALVASALMAAALPYVFNIPPEAVTAARVTMLITGATVAQGFVFNVYVGVLIGIQRYYLVNRLNILFTLVRAAAIVALLSAGYGVIAFGLVHFSVSLLVSLVGYRLTRQYVPYLKRRVERPEKADLSRIVSFGKFVVVTNLGEKLVYAADSLVIGIFLPVAMLTPYAIAGSLVTYLKSFLTAMAQVMNPMSSALEARKDGAALARLFITAAKSSVIIALPVCIGFIVLGERFISLWMGPGLAVTAGPVLRVLAVAHLLGAPYYTMTGVLFGLGRHQITARARVFEATANVILSVILVRRLGLLGVALGTLIPNAVVAVAVLPTAMPQVLSITLKQYYVSTYLRPLLASVPFVLVCYVIETVIAPGSLPAFFIIVGSSLVLYVVPVWWVALSGDERKWALERLSQARGRRARVKAQVS